MTQASQIRTIRARESLADALHMMEKRQYDLSPVFDDDKAVVGILDRHRAGDTHEPAAVVGDLMRPLRDRDFVSADAEIDTLVDRFAPDRENARFLLVVDSDGLDGLVTPSDLDKQAGRTHLYLELAALELLMTERLRDALPIPSATDGDTRIELENALPQEWRDILGENPAKTILGRLQNRRKQDEAVDVLSQMDFAHMLLICAVQLRHKPWSTLRNERGSSPNDLDALKVYRNSIMHATLTVTTDAPESVARLVSSARLVSALLQDAVNGFGDNDKVPSPPG